MSDDLEKRIERMERLLGTRDPPLPAGFGAFSFDGDVVTACFETVTPDGQVPTLADFYGNDMWRDRATCPDADACPYALLCKAGGNRS